MQITPLRGLAALALLCLLPRASALTVTQTHSFSGGAVVAAPGWANVTSAWTFDIPQTSLPLVSVTLNAHFSVSALDTFFNFYAFMLPHEPTATFRGDFYFNGLAPAMAGVEVEQTQTAAASIVAPGGTIATPFTFSVDYSRTFDTAADFAAFAGLQHTLNIGSSIRGGGTGSNFTTGNVTLTFVYNTPDGDGNFLPAFLLVILVFHRRGKRRSFEGE